MIYNEQMLRVCRRCVLDTTDPDITFDDEGLCSHCRRYDAVFRSAAQAAARGERLDDLEQVVTKIQKAGRRKQYDCIVGVSGGVDSTNVLLKATDWGLRPLAVHFDSGWTPNWPLPISSAPPTCSTSIYSPRWPTRQKCETSNSLSQIFCSELRYSSGSRFSRHCVEDGRSLSD